MAFGAPRPIENDDRGYLSPLSFGGSAS